MNTRDDPFEMLEEFFASVSDQFGETPGSPNGPPTIDLWGPTSGRKSMAIDVVDEDDAFVVAVDVPGFEKGDIDVEMADDETITVEADREEELEVEDGEYVRRERSTRSLSRSITLPAPVVREEVTASVEDGVLTLTLPKADPTPEGRQIEIEG